MKRSVLSLLAVMIVVGGSVRAHDELDDIALSEAVVFGNSLSDTGNLFNLFGGLVAAPPYFNGRFTNGPVWFERLLDRLGLPTPAPVLLGGTNHAFAFATTGPGFVAGIIPNIGVQVNFYVLTNTLDGDELVVLWAGANDAIQDVFNIPGNEPETAVANIVDHISTLAAAGAEVLLVPNQYALGQLPRFRGTATEGALDAWSMEFNMLLELALDELEETLWIIILQLDTAELYKELFDDPQEFGLTNVTEPACMDCNNVTGTDVVLNPDEYLFWDSVHPTRTAHRIIGDAAAELVIDELGLDDDEDDDDHDDDDEDG